MTVTIVIITKDRPRQVKRLVDSIFNSEIPSLSLVLVDDSTRENFENIETFLLPYKDVCEHKSSIEVREEVRNILKETALATVHKSSIEICIGLKSPFFEFAESLSKINPFRQSFHDLLSQSFAPYSTARNIGVYYAFNVFNPEKIVFLDDDCYIDRPERLKNALNLVGKRLDGKEIIAVSGLYEDLSLSVRKGRHPYEELTPTSILIGMNSFLKRSFLANQEQRLTVMPYHTLGGALILSKKVFLSLPFDPFIPRGEDHAYCVDLKARFGKNFAIVRDNFFVVQHDLDSRYPRRLQEKNTIRDIFRFVYLYFRFRQCFIPHFTIRQALNSLFHIFLEPWNSKQHLLELWALLFLARIYAKKTVNKYSEIVKAWKFFMEKTANICDSVDRDLLF